MWCRLAAARSSGSSSGPDACAFKKGDQVCRPQWARPRCCGSGSNDGGGLVFTSPPDPSARLSYITTAERCCRVCVAAAPRSRCQPPHASPHAQRAPRAPSVRAHTHAPVDPARTAGSVCSRSCSSGASQLQLQLTKHTRPTGPRSARFASLRARPCWPGPVREARTEARTARELNHPSHGARTALHSAARGASATEPPASAPTCQAAEEHAPASAR